SDSQRSLVATIEESNLAHQFFVLAALVDTTYATGDEATALDLAIATQLLEDQVATTLIVAEHQFYHCLAAAAMCRRRPARRRELEPTIKANHAKLARWASACPANFEAMHMLVEAERTGLSGDLAAAIALYDRATGSAA